MKNSKGNDITYGVKVSTKGFKKPKVHSFQIKNNGSTTLGDTLTIPLKYKSQAWAIGRSIILPGWGHLYMDKWGLKYSLLSASLYSLSIAAALKSDAAYYSNRTDFEAYQEIWKTSPDPIVATQNKELAQKSWDKMEQADQRLFYTIVSAGVTNLAISLLLNKTYFKKAYRKLRRKISSLKFSLEKRS